jgi:hypothetical protein
MDKLKYCKEVLNCILVASQSTSAEAAGASGSKAGSAAGAGVDAGHGGEVERERDVYAPVRGTALASELRAKASKVSLR